MPRFFSSPIGDSVTLTGDSATHISKSLRMQQGDIITVCDAGTDYECEIVSVGSEVTAKVLSSSQNVTEPDIDVTLFQCVPKGDKLEYVIQKAVEMGVGKIVPVLSSRCISRPDIKSAKKKNERYNKIAYSACEQSGRGKLVRVEPMITLNEAVSRIKEHELSLLFYEKGGSPLTKAFKKCGSVCIFIGPEGGFDDGEAKSIVDAGAVAVTLGKRILRTETAPIAALCGCMLLSGNMD